MADEAHPSIAGFRVTDTKIEIVNTQTPAYVFGTVLIIALCVLGPRCDPTFSWAEQWRTVHPAIWLGMPMILFALYAMVALLFRRSIVTIDRVAGVVLVRERIWRWKNQRYLIGDFDAVVLEDDESTWTVNLRLLSSANDPSRPACIEIAWGRTSDSSHSIAVFLGKFLGLPVDVDHRR